MTRLPWQRAASQGGQAKADSDGSPGKAPVGGSRDESSANAGASWVGEVRGERASMVGGSRSLQSRMSSLLAAGLMISVGASMLAWYYTKALSRSDTTRAPTHASLPEAAGEGMTVPPFALAPWQAELRRAASTRSASPVPAGAVRQLPVMGQASLAETLPLDRMLEPPLARPLGGLRRGYGAPAPSSPRQRVLDRRLKGEVFTGGGGGSSTSIAARSIHGESATGLQFADVAERVPARGRSDDLLTTLLQPRGLTATEAQLVRSQRLLLPKGGFIDCTLETAIDSTLPGMTTCITATDTFGADGTVVLLERGTKLIGETRSGVRQGEARVFIAWMEARTPTGVVVQLDSPATDALGRSGLEGTVNRHFWERFGAAALVSMIDGVVQSEVQSSSRGGTVVLDPTASTDVLAEILRSTVNIPPTIRVRNGARVQVLVARDVDFRSVYELETH